MIEVKEKFVVKVTVDIEISKNTLEGRYAEYLMDAEDEKFEPVSCFEHYKDILEEANLEELLECSNGYDITDRKNLYIKEF